MSWRRRPSSCRTRPTTIVSGSSSGLRAISTSATESGAEALIGALQAHGVRLAFGLPGVHNLALWAALRDSTIRLVGVRHEQTAAYAADGLARVTGTLGVALVTTGPGAANTLAAVGEAQASHAPILVVATDIPAALRRPGVMRGVLHETSDQAALFRPLVKDVVLVRDAGEIATRTAQAAALALRAPAGPVLLQVPTDLLAAAVPRSPDPMRSEAGAARGPAAESPMMDAEDDLRSPVTRAEDDLGSPVTRAEDDPAPLAVAVGLLRDAERPLLWAGSGAVAAEAGDLVATLAERLSAPVLETYGARGILAPDHPCRVGLPAHLPEAGALWDAADVVVSVGSDLDGMNTQNWLMPAPPALVTVNVDPDDAGKNYPAAVALCGDARRVLARLLDALGPAPAPPDPAPVMGGSRPGTPDGLARGLGELRTRARAGLAAEAPQAMEMLDALAATVPADVPVACDMCIAGYWVGALRTFARSRRLLYPVGWGTLGYGFPAAIGAALAHGAPTLAVCGDGGFLFGCGELATVAQEAPELTVLLLDDGGYGMLRYDQQQAGTPPFGVDLHTPDFEALATAFGVRARTIEDPGEGLRAALAAELATPGPGLVILRAALPPPPTTSPRWYRRRG